MARGQSNTDRTSASERKTVMPGNPCPEGDRLRHGVGAAGQTGGAPYRALSRSLQAFAARNAFIELAVPHWSDTPGWVESYMCGCQVASSMMSSSVVYSMVLPCGS